MNKLMCYLTSVILLITAVFFASVPVYAEASYSGVCLPENDIPNIFSSVISETIDNPSNNVAGKTIPDFYHWNLGYDYKASCDCVSGQFFEVYYKAVPTLPTGVSIDSTQYYIISENLQFASQVRFNGTVKAFIPVPFTDVSSKKASDVCGDPTSFTTGNQGTISLYIAHPFVGEAIIPSTQLLALYGTVSPGQYASIPLAEVILSGHITVPQGCEMEGGSVLEIPFGEFNGRDFKGKKGTLPEGAQKQERQLNLKCTNISDGVQIYLRIEGNTNPNDNTAIAMGSDDIGARIEAGGKVLIPNDTSSQVEMTAGSLYGETRRDASTTITTYPVATTGNIPAGGDYEGIATLRVDVE